MRKVALIYPRGTCRSPAFYFRGGDGLYEPEILRSSYKQAMEEYNKTKKAHAEAKKEYKQTQAELEDLDECILKMAANMGSDSSETTKHSELRSKIQQLKMDIEDVEKQIAEVNKQCLPFEFTGLVNEHAQFTPTLKELRDDAEGGQDESERMKKEIGELLLSEVFSESVESLIEKQVALDVKAQIRKALNESQNRINQQKSSDTGIICQIDDADLMAKLDHFRDLSLDNLECKMQRDLAETHHNIFIKMEIDRLNEMNEFLDLMKMHDDCIDTDEVYEHCMAEDEEEEEEEEKTQQEEQQNSQQEQQKEKSLDNNNKNSDQKDSEYSYYSDTSEDPQNQGQKQQKPQQQTSQSSDQNKQETQSYTSEYYSEYSENENNNQPKQSQQK